ncbi:MAG: UvrD-helicase domain-containing protein, partial [Butyrivibrio sp.]|nr:UvrD-helicase domain-containing protein [Butyrivibrio sp.]
MKAIHHYEGPAMVLAGPGSGKTFVIVERLRFLIE